MLLARSFEHLANNFMHRVCALRSEANPSPKAIQEHADEIFLHLSTAERLLEFKLRYFWHRDGVHPAAGQFANRLSELIIQGNALVDHLRNRAEQINRRQLEDLETRRECKKVTTEAATQVEAQMESAGSSLGQVLEAVHFELEPPIGLERTKQIRVFIGSSRESLPLADKIQATLPRNIHATVWNQDHTFKLSSATIEDLEAAVLRYDFGVFICTGDDKIRSRGSVKRAPRDNVIFELGLFIGRLTRRRVFVVRPARPEVWLPTDLKGLMYAEYDPKHRDDYGVPNLGTVCTSIAVAIKDAVKAPKRL